MDSSNESILAKALQSLTVNDEESSMAASQQPPPPNSQTSTSSSSTTTPPTTSTTSSYHSSTTTSTTSTTVLNPIYITTPSGNENWELTWPIWHMLPLTERKAIAKQNGFKTIGEFEESVILSRALHEEDLPPPPQPYSNDQLHEYESRPHNFGLPILAERNNDMLRKRKELNHHDYEDDDSDSSSTEEGDDEMDYELIIRGGSRKDNIITNSKYNEIQDQHIEHGGLILLLPPDIIIHFILPFLHIDQYATCALVSPHWKYFTRVEAVYKELCKRCYLQQSKRKTLHVHKFHNSYHTMLNTRFRVKTGCGFYVLKCTKVKKIQRDMWTEIPIGAILESTYYRYLYFFENGTLLYALSSKPPHEMISIFMKMKQQGVHSYESVNGVLGTYVIQKDKVTVNVTHPWHHVRMVLKVLKDGYSGSVGRFWALEFEKHWSSKNGDFDEYWSRDLVEYKIPSDPIFRFLRDFRI